jgi:Icc-related predicted phosphoesterase
MRVLAFADEPPPADPAELVGLNSPDLVVTLGDLKADWIASLADLALPRLGVHGNHDGEYELSSLGITDMHLSRAELGGLSFTGFEGSVRYLPHGDHQYTQEEAALLAANLPGADVLLCHSPPWGVNDDPDDRAHAGFRGLREWVDRHEPRYVLHGHTTPDPRTRVHRLGSTEVVWVRGAMTIELSPSGSGPGTA